MAAQSVILETNPAGPVDFSENAIRKVFETTGWVIADTKEDGVQLNLVVTEDRAVQFLSRAGKFLPGMQAGYNRDLNGHGRFADLLLDDQCIYPNGFMLQAEIVVPGQPAEFTAGLLRRATAKPGKPLLELADIEGHVFGVAPLDAIREGRDLEVTHGIMKVHSELMVALLQKHVPQIKWKMVESLDVFTYEGLATLFETRRAEGKEGLVVKDPNATWKRGKKVGQWKMKPEDTIDGTVCGLVWGTPCLANEGKVIGFEVLLEDGHVVNACGITKEQMTEFTDLVAEHYGVSVDELMHASGSDFGNTAGENPFYGWSVEVSFMERFEDGSLRHPSFNRWRGISSPEVKE
ncbi:hypothetical protein [Pseudomonas sp. SID14000]|uniref:ATP-dependent DNA ligase n=1 Tax=Pseudomonas sp. SID14000 TaxID=1986221 RepID=UPI000B3C1A5D|nr:hypothetical protein [Pseudomonas sp. SID14000]